MKPEYLGAYYESILDKEVRKEGGVYYTPSFIVDSMVENSLGALLKGKTQDELAEIKIVDPSCGGGVFLLGAYQYLLDWHEKHFDKLTPEKRRKILIDNIFGVDIDPLAVEITKYCLSMKCSQGGDFSPDLAENIRCGNSLVDTEFNWHREFFQIFKQDGFDIVIGNPPYVSAPTMVSTNPAGRQAIIDSHRYTTLYQKWDLYIPFMEFGLQMLADSGILAMIVPYPLTNQIYAKKMRELIISQYNLMEIVDLKGSKIFRSSTVSNCIPFISKSKPKNRCVISHINEKKKIKRSFAKTYAKLVIDKKNAVWNLTKEKRETHRHSKMNVLGDFCYISKGMVLNSDEKSAKRQFTKDDLISETPDAVHCRKYVDAKDIERYRVKKIRYLEYGTDRCPDQLSRPTFRELYENQKLMFNRLGNLTVFYDDKTKFLFSDSMFGAVLWKDLKRVKNKSIAASATRYSRYSRTKMETYSERIDLRYLLGILNSKYASVLLSDIRGGDYHIYPEHLRNIPIPLVSPNRQQTLIALVDKVLSAKKKKTADDTTELERQIDRLVYKLYGLSSAEIALVEKC